MVDAEVYVDRIADSRINDMNAMLEAVRQQVIQQYAAEDGNLHTALSYEGSPQEKQARVYLAELGIDYDAITKEQFVTLMDILTKSKKLQIRQASRWGKSGPHQSHSKGKRNRKNQHLFEELSQIDVDFFERLSIIELGGRTYANSI